MEKMNNNPLISIITPVYNNEKYLPYAVRSVTNQGFDDYEMIIVDDGSTDHTPEIADAFAEGNDRIHVIHQKNQWIYASFNNGIKAAKGEYIYILNSDDRLADGSLNRMAEYVSKNPVDVLFTNTAMYRYDYINGSIVYDKTMERFNVDILINDINEVHHVWCEMYFKDQIWNQANLYKRELALRYPFRNDVYSGDVFFNLSIADEVNSLGTLSGECYKYITYQDDDMNASGKYYPYEHSWRNELYYGYKSLFEKWNLDESLYQVPLMIQRLNGIINEIRTLKCSNCKLSSVEKLRKIFTEIPDELISDIALQTGRGKWLDSALLLGTKGIVDRENNSDNHEKGLIGLVSDIGDNRTDKKIVVFGSKGLLYSIIQDILNGYEDCVIVDNDKSKWNKVIDGYQVKNPDILKNIDRGQVIVISAVGYRNYESIKNQVEGYGFVENENFFDGHLLELL